MKHFFFIIFTCVYLKGMRVFNTVHWEGHNSDIWDFFFSFTSNIPNEYNVRGQRGGVIFARSLFAIRGMKIAVGRLLLRWMQKTDFAIQYKLLLLWKEHVGYLLFMMLGLTSLVVISCGCNRKSFVLYDSIKRWNDNQKHYCGRVWYVYVEIFWSPSTHIGKPLTVDLLLYMSSTVCRLFSTTITSFPNALTV